MILILINRTNNRTNKGGRKIIMKTECKRLEFKNCPYRKEDINYEHWYKRSV